MDSFQKILAWIPQLLAGARITILLTICGFTKMPSLAREDTAVINCSGVISNLWPNDIVASSTGPTFSSFRKILPASPGKSIPVFDNSPNFSK